MLGKDTEWYLRNRSKISAFQKYVSLVEADILPTQVADLVTAAAKKATSQINSAEWTVLRESDSEGIDVWWFLAGSYDEDSSIGAWIGLSIPKNVEWLGPESEDVPRLGLRIYGGDGPRGKAKTRELGEIADKAIKALDPKVGKRVNKIDATEYHCCIDRSLTDLLNDDSLARPEVEAELVDVIEKFSAAVLPGLKAVQKHLSNSKP